NRAVREGPDAAPPWSQWARARQCAAVFERGDCGSVDRTWRVAGGHWGACRNRDDYARGVENHCLPWRPELSGLAAGSPGPGTERRAAMRQATLQRPPWQVPVTRLRGGRVALLAGGILVLLIGGTIGLLLTKARTFTPPAVDSTAWPAWMHQSQIYTQSE